MSTPIETNTEELQEILQTVYNLPMAGGGSAEPDLVIGFTLPKNALLADDYINDIENGISIKSGSIADTHTKLMNREEVKVFIEHDYYYGDAHFVGVFYPVLVTAHSTGDDDTYVSMNFLVNMFPGEPYTPRHLTIRLHPDGTLENVGIELL